MKPACYNVRAPIHRPGVPTMVRIRPSWTSETPHLPYSPMTYGCVITRESLPCLLRKWKSEVGRAWEISSVVPTLCMNVSCELRRERRYMSTSAIMHLRSFPTRFIGPSLASNTDSSHLFHPRPHWQSIDRRFWKKGGECSNIGCPRFCFIQTLEDARLCEAGSSIDVGEIGNMNPFGFNYHTQQQWSDY